jgi:hypothetical protein
VNRCATTRKVVAGSRLLASKHGQRSLAVGLRPEKSRSESCLRASIDRVRGCERNLQTRGVVTDLVAHGEVVDATGCLTNAGGLEGTAPTSCDLTNQARRATTSPHHGAKQLRPPWMQLGFCDPKLLPSAPGVTQSPVSAMQPALPRVLASVKHNWFAEQSISNWNSPL